MVRVWREVAGQGRFRHDQTGDQDLGRPLSKSGAGSEESRGSGQYVSPWMMTVCFFLEIEGNVGFSLQSFCAARARPPMPIGRLRSNSHCGEPRWIRNVPVVCRPAGTQLVRSQRELLPIRQPPKPQHTRSLRQLGSSESEDPLPFLPSFSPLCTSVVSPNRSRHLHRRTRPAPLYQPLRLAK